MRQATANDFIKGNSIFDQEGNEFVIQDKYDDGIYNTNKGRVLFVGEARFYRVQD